MRPSDLKFSTPAEFQLPPVGAKRVLDLARIKMHAESMMCCLLHASRKSARVSAVRHSFADVDSLETGRGETAAIDATKLRQAIEERIIVMKVM